MKALLCQQPGDLEFVEIADPIHQPGHAILRVRKIGICGTDLHAYEGTQPYFTYPRILGHELSAEIVQVEKNLGFDVGEIVTIIPYFHCGKCKACSQGKTNCCSSLQVYGVHIDGGMREYISIPVQFLIKGDGLSAASLALAEPLSIGAHGVRRAAIKPGETVLVVGSGPIGLGIIEFAKIAGATVIVLDVNEFRLNFSKQQSKSDYIIKGAGQNVMEQLMEITSGSMPEVVFDATGNRGAINANFTFISHGGRYVLVGLQKESITFSHPDFHKREGTLMSSRNATREDFEFVIGCLQKKMVDPAPFITHGVAFQHVKNEFASWLNPENRVIKAMVSL